MLHTQTGPVLAMPQCAVHTQQNTCVQLHVSSQGRLIRDLHLESASNQPFVDAKGLLGRGEFNVRKIPPIKIKNLFTV